LSMDVPGGTLVPAAAAGVSSGNKKHTRLMKAFFNCQLQERDQMHAVCVH
jgi:hypothetical protein